MITNKRGRTTDAGRDGELKSAGAKNARARAVPAKQKHVLRLYITGTTSRSMSAVANLRKICEENLSGQYDLEIVDIYQQRALAKGEQIIAAPTLIKKLPLPLRRIVGDMSDKERVLFGLDLRGAIRADVGSHAIDATTNMKTGT